MKYILILFLLLITACTTPSHDSNEVMDNNILEDKELQDNLPTDNEPQEISEDEIALDELERLLNILADPIHDPIGTERAEELQAQINYFAHKGLKVQPLQNLWSIINEKRVETIDKIETVDKIENEPIQTCTSNPNPVFTSAFTDTTKIDKISPSGFWMTTEFFKGHSFIWTEGNNVPIYAPVDMTLILGAFYKEGNRDQYSLYFEVSCEVTIKFGHIHEPIDTIKDVFPDVSKDNTRTESVKHLSFKAGDLIGHTRGNTPSGNWDFGVYNQKNLNNIPKIKGDDQKADCPFDYYENNIYKDLYIEDSLLCKR